MRKILGVVLLFLLAGCVSSTQFGECIGFGEPEQPGLVYEPSIRNLLLGALFIETIVVPVVVIVDQAKCPVRKIDLPSGKPTV